MKNTQISQISPILSRHFGAITRNFVALIWGQSGSGKSNLIMKIASLLARHGRVLYVSLEEGISVTLQAKVNAHLTDLGEYEDNVVFADRRMKYDTLHECLRKRRSPSFIIIDSLQYFGISYIQYKRLREEFPNKGWIIISHGNGLNGKLPEGKTADKIRYDSDIKIRVEGYVAFVISRFGGQEPWVIWEEGARKYWGKKYRQVTEV